MGLDRESKANKFWVITLNKDSTGLDIRCGWTDDFEYFKVKHTVNNETPNNTKINYGKYSNVTPDMLFPYTFHTDAEYPDDEKNIVQYLKKLQKSI